MSAQENMNDQQLGPYYHGSAASLKRGDMVEPGRPSHYADKPEPYAFFTKSTERASHYADSALAREPYEAGKDAHVYNVEPTGPYGRSMVGPDWQSSHPLRVLGEA